MMIKVVHIFFYSSKIKISLSNQDQIHTKLLAFHYFFLSFLKLSFEKHGWNWRCIIINLPQSIVNVEGLDTSVLANFLTVLINDYLLGYLSINWRRSINWSSKFSTNPNMCIHPNIYIIIYIWAQWSSEQWASKNTY